MTAVTTLHAAPKAIDIVRNPLRLIGLEAQPRRHRWQQGTQHSFAALSGEAMHTDDKKAAGGCNPTTHNTNAEFLGSAALVNLDLACMRFVVHLAVIFGGAL